MSPDARHSRRSDSPHARRASSHTPATRTCVCTLIHRFLAWFGDLVLFAWQVVRAAVSRPFEGRELIRQLDEIGSRSLPLVALAGAALGFVLRLGSRSSLARFGAKSMLPAALVYSIIHETGPV